MDRLKTKIRDVYDFPKPGIVFKDITPLLKDHDSMTIAVNALASPYLKADITAVVAMEARGFIFGSLVARQLSVGFIPLRKPGKLPADVERINYDLEYGRAGLELHKDAIAPHDRILLIDDVLATGGTAKASCQLVERLGGEVIACAFLIELASLQGRSQLIPYPIHSLLVY
ncbi:MAG: adenine phosphoribosyltransferase [Methylophagaceae bacterium]|jgi:adenine phosphoribosyltransferase